MQTFWQRVRNYLQNLLVKAALLPTIRADQKSVVKSTGQSFRTYATGVSSSAAAIAVGDWSLEIPVPLPPKVHVCILSAPVSVSSAYRHPVCVSRHCFAVLCDIM